MIPQLIQLVKDNKTITMLLCNICYSTMSLHVFFYIWDIFLPHFQTWFLSYSGWVHLLYSTSGCIFEPLYCIFFFLSRVSLISTFLKPGMMYFFLSVSMIGVKQALNNEQYDRYKPKTIVEYRELLKSID